MSGGVDSSTAACLLAQGGRSVVGFSMHLVDHSEGLEESYGRCCSPDDFRDARAVADRIGFPHYIVNLREQFHTQVIRPFAEDYASGRTPSPCIRCNSAIKFGTLLAQARAVGASKLATGHYAILEYDPGAGRTLLRRAVDSEKDQSYFLFDLTEEQRAVAEFPLGRMTKQEVRQRARELGLAAAGKAESMDLCFVREGESYRDFLRRVGLAPADGEGDVVNGAGDVMGRHHGVANFTVGQRRGIGISSDRKLYVVGVDPERKRVTVGEDSDLRRGSCLIERARWIPFDRPVGAVRATVRIRSTHEGSPATIVDLGGRRAEVRFDEPQRAITPGQAAVAYDGDLVLGGGWIAPP
jgi:tRNA-specific 2-thiouridylase